MFELMILFGGIATLIGMVVLGPAPAAPQPRRPTTRASPTTASAWPCHCAPETAASVREILRGRRRRGDAAREVRLHARAAGGRRGRRALGGVVAFRWVNNMTPDRPDHARRARLLDAGGRGGARRCLIIPKEQREVAAKMPNPMKATEASLAIGRQQYQTFCVPCHGAEAKGGTSGPVAHEVHPDAGPDQCRAAAATDRRLLAQLHRGRGRGDAVLRRGAVLRGGVAHRELPPLAGPEMTALLGRARRGARRAGLRDGERLGRGPGRSTSSNLRVLVGPGRDRPRHRRHDAADRGPLVAERAAAGASRRSASCQSPSSCSRCSSRAGPCSIPG